MKSPYHLPHYQRRPIIGTVRITSDDLKNHSSRLNLFGRLGTAIDNHEKVAVVWERPESGEKNLITDKTLKQIIFVLGDRLEKLDIGARNRITGFSLRKLADLKGLKRLYLSEVRIHDSDTNYFPNTLEVLEIISPNRRGDFFGDNLWYLTNLKELSLINCPKVKGIFRIENLKKLKKLFLRGTRIIESALEELPKSLEYINLKNGADYYISKERINELGNRGIKIDIGGFGLLPIYTPQKFNLP